MQQGYSFGVPQASFQVSGRNFGQDGDQKSIEYMDADKNGMPMPVSGPAGTEDASKLQMFKKGVMRGLDYDVHKVCMHACV